MRRSPFPARLLVLVVLAVVAACGGDGGGTTTPPPLTVEVTGTRERGNTVDARVTREGAAVDVGTVQWSFAPATAAEVAGPGRIRLLQAGEVTVTARVGQSTGSTTLAVAEPPPLTVVVQGTPQRGATLTASVQRAGADVDVAQVQWSFAPAGSAEVVAPGQIRLLQAGAVTIAARLGESTGQVVVNVTEPPVPPLVVTVTGDTERGAIVTARVTREGVAVDAAAVTWTAAPASAVENLGGGRFRLLQAGSVTLTASAAGSTGQATLQVVEPAALVVQATGRRERGSALTLSVLRDGVQVSPGDVTWTASPAAAVEIAADGTARLRATGTVTITAGVEHRSGQLVVDVAAPPTVVFDRVVNANRDIWRVALDGGELAAVTTHAGDDQDPTVANGTVVFTSFRGGSGDLYAVPLAGGTTRTVIAGAGNQTAAALTPNGQRVAYANDASGVAKIWTVHIDGTGAARATPVSFGFAGSPEAGPAWNRTGDRIAFVTALSGSSDIYSFAPGTQPTTLVGGAAAEVEPAYSPDGTRVAFASNRDGDTEVYLFTIATGAVVRLTNRVGSDAQPAWTADGRIVFVSVVDGVARLRWVDPANPAQLFDIDTGTGPARNPVVVP